MLEVSKVKYSSFNFFISDETQNRKITFDSIKTENLNSFDVVIEFSSSIVSFRNHDYTWVAISQGRIANDFSPKAIQLQNGLYVQANCNRGIWQINAKNPNQLLWRFNPEFAAPITQYSNDNNTKKIVSVSVDFNFLEELALLISDKGILELSRSPIPFSAIACFTDHCDFDTPENLKVQREFFKEKGIKITKGFFLNHFSKREENASFERDQSELEQWIDDGHELCYHSLTQSIRNKADAFNEFNNFNPSFSNCSVWIDHGFQPYNFSLFQKNKIASDSYEATLLRKNIVTLWNYIDAGIATKGVLNQLDANQFNLQNYYQSLKGLSFSKRMSALLKSIIFHYNNDEHRIRNYIETVTCVKTLLNKKDIRVFFKFLKNAVPLAILFLKVMLTWNSAKKSTFKAAKYSPIFFKHKINKKDFTLFQTIEMLDFKLALAPNNIDDLINESGLFIAHTYFSVNSNKYSGRLLNLNTTLNKDVVSNFNYLALKIEDKSIWNPTLSELISFYNKYQNTIFDMDSNGIIFIKSNQNIPSRTIL